MRNHILCGLALILAATAAPTAAEAITLTANCNADPSNALGNALAGAAPFDVIEVNGTCTQNVTILIDDLTIQGVGGNPMVAGQLWVEAARRVTIQNLTVQGNHTPGLNGIVSINSAAVKVANVSIDGIGDHGVIVLHGASADLNQVTVTNSTRGIVAEDNGSFQVVNSLVESSSDIAIVINRASSGVVIGTTVQNNGGIGIAFALGGGGNVISSTIQNNGSSGVLLSDSASAYIEGSTVVGNAGNGVVVERGSSGNLIGNAIDGNSGNGVVVDGTSNSVSNSNSITNNSGNGISVTAGSHGSLDGNTIQNNADNGIIIDLGASAIVTGSTIESNGSVGITVFRGSSAAIEDNTIQGSPEGVALNTHAIGWLRGNTISTSVSEDSSALGISRGSSAEMRGGNTLTSDGFALFMQLGSTLNQRSGDTVDGPVSINTLSNAELRSVSISGPVAVVDHSLLRIRDQSGDPAHVSVAGSVMVAQDSGLNFFGGAPVKVNGNITCADQESSLGTGTLSHTGMKMGCTGY